MRRLTALLVLAAALAAGCGGDDGATTAATPTATAAPTEDAVAPEPSGAGAPFVGSLAVDPGDGTVLAGTGLGLYRIAPGKRRGTPFEGELDDPGGDRRDLAEPRPALHRARASCSAPATRRTRARACRSTSG